MGLAHHRPFAQAFSRLFKRIIPIVFSADPTSTKKAIDVLKGLVKLDPSLVTQVGSHSSPRLSADI